MLKAVDQRQGGVVVAKQNCRFTLALLCHVDKVFILIRPRLRMDDMHRGGLPAGGDHGLLTAVAIGRDKAVGGCDDLLAGTVVFLHEQNLCARMAGFKTQQGVRVGGTESVNALVLVADHEEILAFRGQQLDDRVLDSGCVLRLIHADIRKALLKGIQHDGIFLQDGIGIGHLIVKVHQVPLPQGVPIPLNDFGQMVDLTVKLFDLFLRQHHVLDVCDETADFPDLTVLRVALVYTLADFTDKAVQFALICHQFKGRLPCVIAPIVVNDRFGYTVDRAKRKPFRGGLTEEGSKAALHVLRRRDGVGHCQDGFRIDSPAENHIPQPGHQHGCFAAARRRQQKYRPVHGKYRFLLLGVQPLHISFFKFLWVQGGPPDDCSFK